MSRGSSLENSAAPVAILGSDAVLAALPATPVQLAHACLALGYAMAFPASWGDELVASGCLASLAAHGDSPAVLCACPHVTERLTRAGMELAPLMISLIPPPVAAARYVRAAFGARAVHVTYVGACPGANDPAIDVRVLPDELFALFAERGIVVGEQPELFESTLPPDRRRFHSIPGGAPAPERLALSGWQLIEVDGEDFAVDLAQRLISSERALLDAATHLGCACSGAVVPGGSHGARAAVVALEPPRARGEVLDASVRVEVARPLESAPAFPPPDSGAGSGAAVPEPAPAEPPAAAETEEEAGAHHERRRPHRRRRSAAKGAAAHPQSVTDAGDTLPRAYLGKQRRVRVLRAMRNASGAKRGQRPEAERRIDRHADPTEPRKNRRSARSVVLPLPSDPPRSVPPPPAQGKPRTLLGLDAVI